VKLRKTKKMAKVDAKVGEEKENNASFFDHKTCTNPKVECPRKRGGEEEKSALH